ncbi:hypothetical protein CAPTEDRAFT_100003 [Capitella teleta]|uniref:Protein kintoun n=1 Tax=Capitella teleta TaxID=283909 RepID=R7UAA5_CAPTE|nr:hypothetical protein CAPTEDRAFT_100003 [Capitella teleta]|eukprot:ELU02899.1 hypothetical protein CAPTEDRAFT_100003 [Capitella teleta]
MATDSKFEDLNLSKDEIDRFTNALKQEEFRKLFVQYAEEISDPVNKARYEAEIAQLENERGMDVKFVHPEAGYVVKTTVNGEQKLFINVCKNETIGKPSSKKESGADGRSGLVWSIPHSFAPPKEDKDKNGGLCKIVDFVVNPDTYRMAETNTRFKQMLHDTAFDGIERQFDMKLDRKNLKFPKLKYKGMASPTVIRTRKEDGDDKPAAERDPDDVMSGFPYPYGDETTAEKMAKKEWEIRKREAEKEKKKDSPKFSKEEKTSNDYETPKYSIKHRSNFDLQDFREAQDAKTDLKPDTLVISIHLPLLKSAAPIDLDIFEKKLTMQSESPAKYKLDLDLPYLVDENEGSASFDKSKRHLIVTLPVIKPKASTNLTKTVDDSEPATEFVKLGEQTKPLIEVLGSQDSGVDYTLPNYEFSQTDETASFVINVSNIVRESVCKTFMTQAPFGADVKFTTMGSGGFPMHYKLIIRLPQVYTVDLDSCDLRLSEQNAVLVLAKADDSLGDWESCYIGLHTEKLEVRNLAMFSLVW